MYFKRLKTYYGKIKKSKIVIFYYIKVIHRKIYFIVENSETVDLDFALWFPKIFAIDQLKICTYKAINS